MENKKIFFEIDANQIDFKSLLSKEFLKLDIKAISSANPNRNNSWFTKESMEKSLHSFYNKPILGHFENDDFVSHNGEWCHDNETDMDYWDTTGKRGERILGVIRDSDPVQVEQDKDGLYWIKVSCVLWVEYNFKQVKRLIKDAKRAKGKGIPAKNVSVEVDITDYEILENGVMKINEFNLVGITILGSRNGVKVEPGIENAGLSVIDIMGRDAFEKQEQGLRLAYAKLDQNIENKKEEFSNMNDNEQNVAGQSLENSGAQQQNATAATENAAAPVTENFENTNAQENNNVNAQAVNASENASSEDSNTQGTENGAEGDQTANHEQFENQAANNEGGCACGAEENAHCDDQNQQCAENGAAQDQTQTKQCEEGSGCANEGNEGENAGAAAAACSNGAEQNAEGCNGEDGGACQQQQEQTQTNTNTEDNTDYCGLYTELKAQYDQLNATYAEAQTKLNESCDKCAKLAEECATLHAELDQRADYADVKDKLAVYQHKEFLNQAYALIASAHLGEAVSTEFYQSCDKGEINDLTDLKIKVALKAFDASKDERALNSTSTFSAPVSSPDTMGFVNKNSKKSANSDPWLDLKDYVGE